MANIEHQALIYCNLYLLQGREFEEINTSKAKVNHMNQVLQNNQILTYIKHFQTLK